MRNLGSIGKQVSHEENVMLSRRVLKGDKRARDKMVTNNIGLAYYHAIRMAELNRLHQQIDPEDILQAAIIGLIKAVDRFDPDRGFRFATYARWWIRKFIGEELVRAHWVTMRPPKVSAEEYIVYKDRLSYEEREEYESKYVWGAGISTLVEQADDTDFTEFVHIMEAAESCLDEDEFELFESLYSTGSNGSTIADSLGITPRAAQALEDRCMQKIREHMQ